MSKVSRATFRLVHFVFLLHLISLLFTFFYSFDKPNSKSKYSFVSDSRDTASKGKTRYALINRHEAVSRDFQYTAKMLKITISEFNPESVTMYGQSHSVSNKLNILKLADFFCSSFDVVVVSDTIPDARFLFERLDRDYANEKSQRCGIKKIVLHMVSRFDFGVARNGVKDDWSEYVKLVARISQNYPTKVVWTANNMWFVILLLREARYIRKQISKLKRADDWAPRVQLIRSHGIASPQSNGIIHNASNTLVTYKHPNIEKYAYLIKKYSRIQFKRLERNYGGPSVLAQYRALIDFPYQPSTMSTYENLAFGVVILVPSYRFLQTFTNVNLRINADPRNV